MIETSCWRFWDEMKAEIEKDQFITKIKAELTEDEERHKGFQLYQGNLHYKGRLVIPHRSRLLPKVLAEFHDSVVGGHSGELKTYQRIAAELYWVGMKHDVANYVKNCGVCQRHKYLTTSPAGLLQPIPLPLQVWEEVTMDFIEGLPTSKGWNTIIVVVDRLTKYAHFLVLKHPYNATMVAQKFMAEIAKLHGSPLSIITDRDRIFLSKFWDEMFKMQGVELKKSTTYHPQTDGQTEVVNRCVETYLRCFCSGKPTAWARWLPWAEYWYNTSYHTAIKTSPFKALYGRDPPAIIWYEGARAAVDTVDQLLGERDEILDDLRMNLLRAQQRMQQQANRKRRDEEFEEGDQVYLKLRPYRQQSLATRKYEKLAARYYGPYKVQQRIGKVAYRLQLPEVAKIHPVFHVSQLKPAKGNVIPEAEFPIQLTSDLERIAEPEEVLGVRRKSGVQGGELEVLVKWRGVGSTEATWEDYHLCNGQFSEFHLEDKVKVLRAGIDKPPIWLTYKRKAKAHIRDKGGKEVVQDTELASGPADLGEEVAADLATGLGADV